MHIWTNCVFITKDVQLFLHIILFIYILIFNGYNMTTSEENKFLLLSLVISLHLAILQHLRQYLFGTRCIHCQMEYSGSVTQENFYCIPVFRYTFFIQTINGILERRSSSCLLVSGALVFLPLSFVSE